MSGGSGSARLLLHNKDVARRRAKSPVVRVRQTIELEPRLVTLFPPVIFDLLQPPPPSLLPLQSDCHRHVQHGPQPLPAGHTNLLAGDREL